MASTITNFSSVIDAQFPVPGQDNDTQGFRNNFSNIRDSLGAAAAEITDLQVTNIGIINSLNNITNPENISVSIITATSVVSESITNNGNITSTGNIVASGNITTNGKFIGDGSLLSNIPFTNVTSVGTLTSLSVLKTISLGTGTNKGADSISMTVSKDKLLIDGASSIKFITTETLTKSLLDIDLSSPLGYVSTLTLNNVTGLEVGYTFQFYSTETSVHIINSINTVTNKITTDLYNHNEIQDYGYGGVGSNLTFKIARTNDIIELQNQINSNTNAISKLSTSITTTNVTIKSNTATDITAAIITAENNRLLLNGVSGITLVGTNATTVNLVAYEGAGPGFYVSTLTLTSVSGIDVGYTFKLYSTETNAHTVIGVNTTTNQITTDAFDSSIPQDYGYGSGSPITFTQGTLIGSASYAASAPVSNIGKATDRKGYIYANTSTVYVCFKDYDGTSQIWNIFDNSVVPQLITTATNNFNNIAIIQASTSSLTTRVTALEAKRTYYASAAPASSKGQPGDLKGTVFATSAYIYICYADYTTGTNDIWTRTAITDATW